MAVAAHEDEVAEVARWAEGIERVHECIAPRFRRPEPRRRALEYLRGLLSPVERKNGWQLAEQAGNATRRLMDIGSWWMTGMMPPMPTVAKINQVLRAVEEIQIDGYRKLVDDRNDAAHANGNIFFQTQPEVAAKINQVLRAVEEIQTYFRPTIIRCYEEFLLQSSNPGERESLGGVVKSAVIPARVGIRINLGPNTTLLVRILDSRLRGNDGNMQ